MAVMTIHEFQGRVPHIGKDAYIYDAFEQRESH